MSWVPVICSWKGLDKWATTRKQKNSSGDCLHILSSYMATGWAFMGFKDTCPGCWGETHHFSGDFHHRHLNLHVPSERGIDSHPAGWMAPTSCPVNVGCLPRLLSDSTISQWHPGTHWASRKSDVLQEQMRAARPDGNSSRCAHSEALDMFMASCVWEPGMSSSRQDNQYIDRHF